MQESVRAFEHPGFIIRLILEGTNVRFEPDFPDFELVLLNVYDVMVKAVGIVPRVETKLYSEWVGFPRQQNLIFSIDLEKKIRTFHKFASCLS